MKTVKQVSALTGISVRTLHHYDAIGLLKPTRVTQAGYRLYDDHSLRRLQTILLLRELEFPLKQIRDILASPDFDPMEALEQQIHILELKQQHLQRLILHARQIQQTGVFPMNFTPFDTTELDTYTSQAKEKWGHTQAWQEFCQKSKHQTPAQQNAAGDGLMAIFTELGAIRHSAPSSPEAQALVQKLQSYITEHYYTCTPQILRGLGQMYIAGDSMTENIDRAGGEGTAEFAHQAIESYCK